MVMVVAVTATVVEAEIAIVETVVEHYSYM